MLQDVRTNAMQLIWETDGNLAHHFVDWGRQQINENTLSQIESLQIDANHFVHRVTITGLEAETSYVYRVRSGTKVTPVYSFTTAPRPSSPFVTAWWGDNHAATTIVAQHLTHILARSARLICVAGDMVNSGNAINEWHDYWFKPFETLNAAQTTPVIFARGNHDGESTLPYAYSHLPGNESWYAFDYGNSRFIFLDSEASTSTSIEQYNWLKAELNRPETQRAAFRIVCFHRPPYVNLWNGGGYTGEGWVQQNWVPLFSSKNVDMVIGGHMHAYQRGMTNGVMYAVIGGGGGALDTERVANWPFTQAEIIQYHFGLMEISGTTLTWKVYNTANQLLDTFQLQSRAPKISWRETIPVGGMLNLTLSGKPNTSYVWDFSADLDTWTAFATNTIPAIGTPMLTNAVSAHTPGRFYRARTNP
jgi:predicted phosphodiesterase